MNARTEKRRVLILFLETLDAETLPKLRPLKNLLSASNVELFVVNFAGRLVSGRGGLQPAMSRSFLKELVQATSGEAYFTADHREHLEDITRPIYNQIRTFYTLGFEAASDGPFRLTIRSGRPGSKVRHHPTAATISLSPSSPQ